MSKIFKAFDSLSIIFFKKKGETRCIRLRRNIEN
jgi:hypothetical protein